MASVLSRCDKQEQMVYNELVHIVSICSGSERGEGEIRAAEKKKEALEALEEYSIALCMIIGNTELSIHERQLAAVLLKNYLQEIYQGTKEYALLQQKGIPQRLCQRLLILLKDSFKRIKVMVAECLHFLTALDMWGILSTELARMLRSGNYEDLYNAVFALSSIINEGHCSKKNFKVSPVFYQLLLDIVNSESLISEIRCMALGPLVSIIKSSYEPSNLDQGLVALAEVFEKASKEPFSGNSNFFFKCKLVKCVLNCSKICPPANSFTPRCLPMIGQLMMQCCEIYIELLQGSSEVPRDEDERESEDPRNFFNLVVALLMFTKCMIEQTYFEILLDDLESLLYCLFIFMGCCYDGMEQALIWKEEDMAYTTVIRNFSAYNFLLVLRKIKDRRRKGTSEFFEAMCTIIKRLTLEAFNSRLDVYKVRIAESAMYGLGMAANHISENPYYLFHELTDIAIRNNRPLLSARLLWLGGKYSIRLLAHDMESHIVQIVSYLTSDAKCLYPASLEALTMHLQKFPELTVHNTESAMVIVKYSKDIMECLMNMHHKMLNNFSPWLTAIGYFIEKLESYVRQEYLDALQDVMMRTLFLNSFSVSVTDKISFILSKIASHNFEQWLYHTFVPFLLGLIHAGTPNELRIQCGTPDKGFEMLNTILIHSTKPIEDRLITQVYDEAVVHVMNEGHIEGVEFCEEAAGRTLITLIVKLSDRLKLIRNERSRPLLESLPELVLSTMANNNVPHHIMTRLIIVSLFHLPDILKPHLEQILKNVITTTDEHIEKIKSTWMLFLFICMIETHNTIHYLSILPGPDGGSALENILGLWAPCYLFNMEPIDRQIMCLALTSIVNHCLHQEEDRNRLNEITIGVDRITDDEEAEGSFTGLEYLYYQIISFVFFERKLIEATKKKQEHIKEFVGYDQSDDFEEVWNMEELFSVQEVIDRTEEDNKALFKDHPFNISVLYHVTEFLKNRTEPYFNVCQKFVSNDDQLKLSELGCAIPPLNVEME